MAERLTRSRAQVGLSSPSVVDPTVELLCRFSEARQDAIAVLQGAVDGRRKLSEACAKVRQASTQLLEMVRDDLEYLEDPLGEGGGLAKPTTARLPQAQAGRAISFLVDTCHLTMRAVLQQCEQDKPVDPTAPPGSGQLHSQAGAGSGAAGRDDSSGGDGGGDPAAAVASAQLWRGAVSVAVALRDASRLLAVPRLYSAFTLADPSCDALLSLGELAAAVMRQAAAASGAATAAARAALQQRQLPMRHHAVALDAQGHVKAEAVQALVPPDASCLLAAHGSSLLLGTCEQQPEGLLDALLRQPGASDRLHVIASATLALAAARIRETAFCGGGADRSEPASCAPPAADLSAASAQPVPWPPSSSSSSFFSYQFRQLQLVSMRFSELLADDGSYKALAKRQLVPALAEALMAEPHRFASWWGCGRDALFAGLSARDLLTAPQLEDRAAAAAAAAATATAPASPPPPQLPPPPPSPPECASSHDDKLQIAAVGLLLRSPAARNELLPLLLACVRLPGPGSGLAAFGEGFLEERFICAPGSGGGEGPVEEREELYVGGRGRGYKRRKILNPDVHGVNTEQVGVVMTAMASALECAVLLCKTLSNASVDAPPPETTAEAAAVPNALIKSDPSADDDDPIIGPPRPRPDDGGGSGPQSGGDVAVQRQSAIGEPALSAAAEGGSVPLVTVFQRLLEARCDGGGGASGGGAGSVTAAVRGQLEAMGRNLAALLSSLLPVCPGGGEEVRDAMRQLGYPTLRWPRMNVRLPVLVVDQDCELLGDLLEDLNAAAAEAGAGAAATKLEAAAARGRNRRPREEAAAAEQQHRLGGNSSEDRDDRQQRLKQRLEQEATAREAAKRHRDTERRQRDRDRAKTVREAEMVAAASAAAGGGAGLPEYDGGHGGGGAENGQQGLAVAPAAPGAVGQHGPRVRLVLRREGGGGGGQHGVDAARLQQQQQQLLMQQQQRKRGRLGGEGEYDEAYDPARDEHVGGRDDAQLAARRVAAGGLGGNALPPDYQQEPSYRPHHNTHQYQHPHSHPYYQQNDAIYGTTAEGEFGGRKEEEGAALASPRVPRPPRPPPATRPARATPPPPDATNQRAAVGPATAATAAAAAAYVRRTSASGGGGGYPQQQLLHYEQQYEQQMLQQQLQQQQQQQMMRGGYDDAPSPAVTRRLSAGAPAGGATPGQLHYEQHQYRSHYQQQQQQQQHAHQVPRRSPQPSAYGMGHQLQEQQQQQQQPTAPPRSRQPPPSYASQDFYLPSPSQPSPSQQRQQLAAFSPRAAHPHPQGPSQQHQPSRPAGAVDGGGGMASPHGRGLYAEEGGWAGQAEAQTQGQFRRVGDGLPAVGARGGSGGGADGGMEGGGHGSYLRVAQAQPQTHTMLYQQRYAQAARPSSQALGGGGGYAPAEEGAQAARQHAVDPYGIVQQQQQLHYQQQHYQQQYQ